MSMKGPQEAVSVPSQINDLVEGVCVDYLHAKIKKIIFKQFICYPIGRLGPMLGMEQLQLVVFENTVGFCCFLCAVYYHALF